LARLVLSGLAAADLDQIRSYITRERSQGVAEAVLVRLYNAMNSLADAPRIGRIRNEYRERPRSFAVQSHVIFYEPLKQGDGIAVWRVLHGARDLPKLLHRPFGGDQP